MRSDSLQNFCDIDFQISLKSTSKFSVILASADNPLRQLVWLCADYANAVVFYAVLNDGHLQLNL